MPLPALYPPACCSAIPVPSAGRRRTRKPMDDACCAKPLPLAAIRADLADNSVGTIGTTAFSVGIDPDDGES